KGLFNKYTIQKRESRATGRSSVIECRGYEMRGESVEIIRGFGQEEVEKLLLCGTLRASSDEAEHNLEKQWRKHNVLI
ncbi:hypothetical protein A2U01_0097311, partial [Trifolium medium]|nr:hypothetical protein [Trifolium medium]